MEIYAEALSVIRAVKTTYTTAKLMLFMACIEALFTVSTCNFTYCIQNQILFIQYLNMSVIKYLNMYLPNKHCYYHDSTDEWILKSSSFTSLQVFAHQYHYTGKKVILRSYETVHLW